MGRERDQSFADFAERASGSRSVEDTIREIVTFGLRNLSADQGGVTLLRPQGRLVSAGATDSAVEQADKLQHALREGPCVQSAEQLREITSPDLEHDRRWPIWGPQVADLGLRSIVSVPLSSGPRRLGALNFYGADLDQFNDDDLESARFFAAHAAAALDATITAETLRAAIETRTVIGQAQGILMERYSLDAKQSFAVLRRYSQNNNVRLHDLAEHLIKTGDLDSIDGLPRTDRADR